MTDKYIASRYGAAFADDGDNPTVEISVTPVGERDGATLGYAVEGNLYPYRMYDEDGNQRGDFEDFQFSLDHAELEAMRDMLTDLIEANRHRAR